MNKVMFEIYRDAPPHGPVRVIYYTELDEHSREREIQRALSGAHIHDGFLHEQTLAHAKLHMERLLRRLNTGSDFDATAFERDFREYLT